MDIRNEFGEKFDVTPWNDVILCGIPGSGKSYLAQEWASENRKVVSADHHFVGTDGVYRFDPAGLGEAHANCLLHYVAELRTWNRATLVDNTNTRIEEIAPYVALSQAHGREHLIVIMKTPLDLCVQRNREREEGRRVPEYVIGAMHERLLACVAQMPPRWNVVQLRTSVAENVETFKVTNK